MAKQTIGIGSVANDGTGDDARTGAQKINNNFTELYAWGGDGTSLTALATVATTGAYADLSGTPTIPSALADLDTTVTGAQLDALKAKVDLIEAGATADQTGAEIVAAIDATLGSATWQGGGGGAGTDDQTAAEVPFTPAGSLAATDVQAAIEELDAEKATAAQGATADSAVQPGDNVSTLANDAAYIAATDVTYENLSANGDVGTGAAQVAAGDHDHAGTYQPLSATLTSWAGKTVPTGTVVGTDDVQTLTGKSIDAAQLTGTVSVNRFNSGTGATSATYLRGDGSWGTPAGSGDVSKVGTPVANRLAYWTGDGTLGHEDGLTYDPVTDTLAVTKINIGGVLFDGANQPADPNADRLLGWDDSAGISAYFAPAGGLEISGTSLQIADGGVTVAKIGATGTPGAATFLRGDGAWAAGGGSGISNLVEDLTPQLGGDLDLNGHNVTGQGMMKVTGGFTPATAWDAPTSNAQFIGFNQAASANSIQADASDTLDDAPSFIGLRAKGTVATPTAATTGAVLARLQGNFYNGSAFPVGARVDVEFDGTGGRIALKTGTSAGTQSTKLQVDNAGVIAHANGSYFSGIELGAATDTTLTRSGPGRVAVEGAEVLLAGKQHLPISAVAMTPRTTNGAARGLYETTTNKVMRETLDFDSATEEFAQFAVQMPKNWNEGTLVAQVAWTHGSTTTNFGVAWGVSAVAIGNNEAFDSAFGTEVVFVDTGGTTDRGYITPESAAITVAGSPGPEEWVVFQVARKVANASDTMAVDARLLGLKIHYTIDAANVS